MPTTHKKFEMGRLVATAGVASDMHKDPAFDAFVKTSLDRHLSGDWGALSSEDAESNDAALESGEDRIFSVYYTPYGAKLWIITEWDRSVTTVLFPEDY